MSNKMKECVVDFDEIKFLKTIEGYENLGELSRKPVLEKSALILMLREKYSS